MTIASYAPAVTIAPHLRSGDQPRPLRAAPAAGRGAQLRSTYNRSMLAKYSGELFPELERLTGLGTGFRRTGSILLATTDERWTEGRRPISMARVCGFEVQPR